MRFVVVAAVFCALAQTPPAPLAETPCAGTSAIAAQWTKAKGKWCKESLGAGGKLTPLARTKFIGSGAAYGLGCPIASITEITDSAGVQHRIQDIYWGATYKTEAGPFPTGLPANWFAALNFNVSSAQLRVKYTSSDPACGTSQP